MPEPAGRGIATGDPHLEQNNEDPDACLRGWRRGEATSPAGNWRIRSDMARVSSRRETLPYLSVGKAPNQQGIYAASLDSNDRTFIVATNTNAAWLQSGQLLFMRGNALMAQPFDIGSLKLSGEPHPVADRIESGATRSNLPIATFAASPNGVLLWRHDNYNALSSLQWFDRNGKGLGVVGEAADYSNPALLPGRQQTGRQHPRPADKDTRHLDLRFGLRYQDPPDLRSRRRPGLHLVAGRNADRLHLRPRRAKESLLEARRRFWPGGTLAGR